MKRFAICMVALGMMFGWLSGDARAQARRYARPPIGKYQPHTSPALNMLGPGGPAYGYLTGTVPQDDYRQQSYSFNRGFQDYQKKVNRSFNDVNQSLQNPQAGSEIRQTLGTTGHPTTFMNHMRYFPASAGGR